MSDVLVRIKRAILEGRYAFSQKALAEMDVDGITVADVIESIVNAVAIHKKIRSTSASREHKKEYLYIIQSANLDGMYIYSKGKFTRKGDAETYYFLISSKRSA